MDIVQITLLSFVQGLTEFLPISSSGHLILTPLLFGYELHSLSFDIAVHIGSLVAVMIYFRQELGAMTLAVFGSLRQRTLHDPQARLGWMLVLATLPLVVLGLPLKWVLEFLRGDPWLVSLTIAVTMIVFGLLLLLADHIGTRRRDEYQVHWRAALLIGLMQAVAVIPGTSRSGITMTAGLFLGLTRRAASRFSFLLSIPTLLMAGLLEVKDLLVTPDPVDWTALWLGAVLSFFFAYVAIHYFLRYIERISMTPFVIYRMLLAALILFLLLR
ncbi:MAG: undecaprenyl-diphosphate phosphatase [Chromatiaceae bacterium]|nr:MAG: undecaprenyl-diphosphate phosphatase [Chromatiaceae bacterium]